MQPACKFCGKPLQDNSTNKNKKWCSEVCRNRFKRREKRVLFIAQNKRIQEGGEMSELDLGKLETSELLEEVSTRGFISTRREILVDRHYKFPPKRKPFSLGIVSDTHFGSTCQQITLLHEAYKIMAEKGIKQVLHAGDVTEGNGKQHKGQIYEMFLHGADNMADYVVKNYPRIKGIKTHIIGGSHDDSFFKEDGTNILARIAERRRDIKYHGMYGAYMEFGNIKIYLMHGNKGVAYARSYKMQKIIEQFPPKNKPNILLLGHYHVECYLPNYRNVIGLQLPCFQTQTNYLRAGGLSPEIGFIILHVQPDANGIRSHTVEFHPFFVPKEGDY
jgi:predicted phosphodiesterase